MNTVIHEQAVDYTQMPAPEVWTHADNRALHEYAGSTATAHELELAATEDLARQQAEAIAATYTHRVTSATAVGTARVGKGGEQFASINRENYINTQRALFSADQQMKNRNRNDEDARRAHESDDDE